MIKKFLKIFKYAILVGILILGFLILLPRTYDVPPFKARTDINYWELDSGSKIGYIFLEGNIQLEKPPIIYLHGGPGGMVYDKTIKLLQPLTEQGYDIYLYDQIGSGHSARLDNIKEYTVERHKQDLKQIIEKIKADKVILFAHSWGTMLATDFFSEYQHKIDGMIFSGPGPILPVNRQIRNLEPPDSLNLIAPRFTNKEANQSTYNIRSKFIDYTATIFQKKLATDQEVDAFFTLLNGQLNKSTTCNGSNKVTYNSGVGYYAHIMTLRSFSAVTNKRELLKENDTPLLILRGQCDNQKWGFTQEYLNLFPKSELRIIESAGHSIEVARHKEYLEIILNFLNQV